jgi:UDP:flavonoid glycosyltransferase YjiC (YdhE family)
MPELLRVVSYFLIPFMTKILITCVGTRGDVQPFLGLAKSLIHSGQYQVTLVADSDAKNLIQSHGVDYLPFSKSIQHELLHTEAGKATKKANVFQLSAAVKAFMTPLMESWWVDIQSAIRLAKPDIVILTTFPFLCGCAAIAENESVKNILVAHTVPAHPTSEFAPTTASVGFTLPFRFLNKLIWSIGEYVASKAYEGMINKVRSDFKMPPLIQSPSKEAAEKKWQFLYVYSESLIPKPLDWDANCHVIGNPTLSEDTVYTPKSDLNEFLAETTPTVYIGLGSMLGVIFDTREEIINVLNTLIDGVRHAQKHYDFKVILHTFTFNDSKVAPSNLKSDDKKIFLLDYPVPHIWLLPRCTFLVHHAGAGTTQAGFRAGKPCICLPCGKTSDQPFWADLVFRKRCGPRGLPIWKINPTEFGNRLVDCFQNKEEYTSNCEKIMHTMNQENPVENFLSVIKKSV